MGEVIIRKADPDSGSPVYTLSVASQLSKYSCPFNQAVHR